MVSQWPDCSRSIVFGAKSKKKKNRTPPVPQSPITHGAVSLTPPADLNSRVAGTVGTREVGQREGDSGGGVGTGLHCSAVNSSSDPSGAPPVSLMSTAPGRKPANVCKILRNHRCSAHPLILVSKDSNVPPARL